MEGSILKLPICMSEFIFLALLRDITLMKGHFVFDKSQISAHV